MAIIIVDGFLIENEIPSNLTSNINNEELFLNN